VFPVAVCGVVVQILLISIREIRRLAVILIADLEAAAKRNRVKGDVARRRCARQRDRVRASVEQIAFQEQFYSGVLVGL
jgi:hypothetical protein